MGHVYDANISTNIQRMTSSYVINMAEPQNSLFLVNTSKLCQKLHF